MACKRQRPENVKEKTVKEFAFKNIRTEHVAKFEYRSAKCKKTCPVVPLCENLSIEKGELVLFDDIHYFFYITNDQAMTPREFFILPMSSVITKTIKNNKTA